ncbi:MAG: DegQ family serine endoprotease [Panacagrimonas sp.]|jgi:serine protease Do/serine protease DegQ|nr:DegQ family serine endoprotease [Panacagrimonas sp.]MCC2657355.1 DegQ family serine endoprotease [Panacagrimonas sp.]
MSRNLALKVAAPLVVSAGVLSFAFMSSAPVPGQADIVVPMQQGVPSLAPMLKQVMPGVVNISVTAKVEIQNPLLQDPFFRRFFEGPNAPEQPQERDEQSTGSGVIVDAAKGYVITNNHVVDQAESIKVRLSDDREFEAKLIGKDPQTDVAILQIKADKLTAIPLADSDKVQVGDFVVAIGSPFGLRQTVTSGIISATGRYTGISEGGYEDFIQTDASINPGNSGGALVNLNGQLVGIPSNILSRSGGNIGIGFAIPINQARGVMSQLIEHGSVQRGRIGVVGQDVTPDLAKAFGLPSARGAVVAQVVPDSPAAKAGLKPEDIVLEANGREVQSMAQLRNIVGLMRVGEKVDLKVLREGKPRNLTVVIGKDTEQASSAENLHPALTGATFAPLDDATAKSTKTQGVLVQKVAPGSPAARTGLRDGDVVLAVNREPTPDLAKFNKLAGVKEGQLLLHVQRGNGALFIIVR